MAPVFLPWPVNRLLLRRIATQLPKTDRLGIAEDGRLAISIGLLNRHYDSGLKAISPYLADLIGLPDKEAKRPSKQVRMTIAAAAIATDVYLYAASRSSFSKSGKLRGRSDLLKRIPPDGDSATLAGHANAEIAAAVLGLAEILPRGVFDPRRTQRIGGDSAHVSSDQYVTTAIESQSFDREAGPPVDFGEHLHRSFADPRKRRIAVAVLGVAVAASLVRPTLEFYNDPGEQSNIELPVAGDSPYSLRMRIHGEVVTFDLQSPDGGALPPVVNGLAISENAGKGPDASVVAASTARQNYALKPGSAPADVYTLEVPCSALEKDFRAVVVLGPGGEVIQPLALVQLEPAILAPKCYPLVLDAIEPPPR